MKMNRLFSALLAFILLACLSGVQGQYVAQGNGSSDAPGLAQNTSQYSQFYTTLTGSAPNSYILPPVQFNLTGKTPASVYFGIQMQQQVPYTTYQSTASGNALWIQGATDWSQYAVVPQGAMVSLLATSPDGGSGNLILVDSIGQNYSYFFYPVSQLGFYAYVPGRHALSFITGEVASNPVVIDVSGTVTMTYNPTSNYFPPETDNSVKSLESYPGYNIPFDGNAPQAALENAAANKVNQKMFGNYDIKNPYAWDYAAYQWMNSP